VPPARRTVTLGEPTQAFRPTRRLSTLFEAAGGRGFFVVARRDLPLRSGVTALERRVVAAAWNRRVVVALVLVSVAAPLVPAFGPSARAQTGGDARSERERVRSERAELALQIDALQADDASLDRAARDIDDNLRLQQALLADAERASAEAAQLASQAEASAAAKAAELDELKGHMAAFAVDAYVNPPGADVLDRLKADSASDAAQKQALLDLSATRASDVGDQLRAARHAFEQEKARAETARADADERRRDAQRRSIELQQAQAAQVQFASQLEERLNAKLAEANALAATDATLSATIAAEQAALAQQLRAMAPARPAPAASAPTGSSPPPRLPAVPLKTVRGITVNERIAASLDAMLAAASADGLSLGGTGYRDSSQQIALRRAHCGTDDYAIYQMPPFLCTPPTAIPGSSMHEQGLAVDFTWKGQSLTDRANPAFVWLAANAARFGFYNLPSEPWHWSVNGK